MSRAQSGYPSNAFKIFWPTVPPLALLHLLIGRAWPFEPHNQPCSAAVYPYTTSLQYKNYHHILIYTSKADFGNQMR